MVILYSTGCPKCDVLKNKLAEKNIKYKEENDKGKMIALGIDEVPVLAVGDKLLKFKDANEWIKNQ